MSFTNNSFKGAVLLPILIFVSVNIIFPPIDDTLFVFKLSISIFTAVIFVALISVKSSVPDTFKLLTSMFVALISVKSSVPDTFKLLTSIFVALISVKSSVPDTFKLLTSIFVALTFVALISVKSSVPDTFTLFTFKSIISALFVKRLPEILIFVTSKFSVSIFEEPLAVAKFNEVFTLENELLLK